MVTGMQQNVSQDISLNNGPLVSIVLPSYNGERYLAQSIESCLNQTYRNLELILVDDCSTDNTLVIMQLYAQQDTRITVLHNEKNSHIAASLNRGFAVAKGTYFSWTSDDNYYDANAIEEMVKAIEQQESDIVYADFRQVDARGSYVRDLQLPACSNHLLYRNIICACFLYKRLVHTLNNGYDTNSALIEDYKFWVESWCKKLKFFHLNKILYSYRTHQSALSTTKHREVLHKHLDYILCFSWKYDSVDCEIRKNYCAVLADFSKGLPFKKLKPILIFLFKKRKRSFFKCLLNFCFYKFFVSDAYSSL